MPWIEGRTNPEPGGYYDQARDGGPVRLLQVLPNGYVLMPDGLRAPAGAVFMSHRKSLRIPSPSVLLAMEEVIAAVRKAYPDELIGFSRRLTNALSALARAEAEAKGGEAVTADAKRKEC